MTNIDDDILAPIYNSINWEAPKTIRCEGCKNIPGIVWRPKSGSHPSSLSHFEAILGRLDEPRTKARILIVLQDPRSNEEGFKIADPSKAPTDLAPDEHRYFCLTSLAWRALKLDKTVGFNPCWPTIETAHYFLARYFSINRSWSYDGFLAYFLYLFRPESAVITNLAKCYFTAQNDSVYRRCAEIHLETEAVRLRPNLIIAIGKKCNPSLLRKYVPSLRSVPLLHFQHPAAGRGNHYDKCQDKYQHIINAILGEEKLLHELGYDVLELIKQWEHDVNRTVGF